MNTLTTMNTIIVAAIAVVLFHAGTMLMRPHVRGFRQIQTPPFSVNVTFILCMAAGAYLMWSAAK